MKATRNTTEYLDRICKDQRRCNNLVSKDDDFIRTYLICKICKEVLHNPKECGECEENFCESCINDYFNKNKLCLNSCMEKKIIKSHPLIISKLEKLLFSCMYCQKHVQNLELPRHLTLCENRKEICKNDNCKFIASPSEVDKHAEACEYTYLFCPICKSDFQKIDGHRCGDLFLQKYKTLKDKYLSNSKAFDTKIKELENLLDNAIKIATDQKFKVK
jgi:hypothetical protein